MKKLSRKTRIYLATSAVVLIVFAISAYVVSRTEVVTLRAEGQVPIRKSPVLPPTADNLVFTLKVGEIADVVECENIKTDQIILVRGRTGELGYVYGDDFVLIRHPFRFELLLSTQNRYTISCAGMFENNNVADDERS